MTTSNRFKSNNQIELLASLYGGEHGVCFAPETPVGKGGLTSDIQVAPPQSLNSSSLPSNQPKPSISTISGSGPGPDIATGFERSEEPLGIHAESSSPYADRKPLQPAPPFGCSETEADKKRATDIKIRELRADRYRLQNGAAELAIMEGEKQKDTLRNGCALNYHRVCKCRRTPYSAGGDDDDVKVMKSKEHGKAFYGGLVVCGNVWVCPVCAGVVQERRRIEIAKAIEWAYQNDLKPVMITLTFSHQRFDGLKDLLTKQQKAFVGLRGGKAWAGFKDRVGYKGLIRSLEVTHGNHGWHPHTHELWFVKKTANAEYIKNFVTDRWFKVCSKAGLVPRGRTKAFKKHSVDVKDNCSASDYLAKQDDSRHWGADREIAKASVKEAYGKGKHPFALLDEYTTDGNRYSGRLFLEYLEAMRGRPQIFWSHGLKALVGVDEKTDEEIAAEAQDAADLLARLNRHEWKLVLKYKARALILDIAETAGLPGIHQWLSETTIIEFQDSS